MSTVGYALIFDLDGVLADWSHRRYHYGTDWSDNSPDMLASREVGNLLIPNDEPIGAGVVLFNMLITQAHIIGRAIVGSGLDDAQVPFVDILTCRPNRLREVTVKWMNDKGLLAPRALHMRADDDHRPHEVIKMEMYEKFYKGKEDVMVLFEDNERTIKAFREAGITVYQVC